MSWFSLFFCQLFELTLVFTWRKYFFRKPKWIRRGCYYRFLYFGDLYFLRVMTTKLTMNTLIHMQKKETTGLTPIIMHARLTSFGQKWRKVWQGNSIFLFFCVSWIFYRLSSLIKWRKPPFSSQSCQFYHLNVNRFFSCSSASLFKFIAHLFTWELLQFCSFARYPFCQKFATKMRGKWTV